MNTINLGFKTLKINKKTGKVQENSFQNSNKTFYTASTIKVVLAGLFYENCLSELNNIIKITNKDKFIGGILCNNKGKIELSYEILIHLMLTISDNTATNIIFDKLNSKLGDLTIFITDKFNLKNTKILDIREQQNSEYIMGTGTSTPQEFSQLLKYFLVDSKYAKEIRTMMSNQYIKGRGLRYFDRNDFEDMGNKSGQLDDMINDCGFIETENDIFLYSIFMKVPKNSAYEYQVENKYYKKIGKIILNSFEKLNSRNR